MRERVSTGHSTIDSLLYGGLEFGHVTYVFGRCRGSFKTILALNLSLSLAQQGVPVCIFSLEATNIQVAKRIVKFHRLVLNNTLSKLILLNLPLYLCDKYPIDMTELEAKIESVVHNHNCKVIFIDYLQLLSLTNVDIGMTRPAEVCCIAQELEKIADRLNISIVVNVQLKLTVSKLSKRKYDYHPIRSEFIDAGLRNVIQFYKSTVLVTHRPCWYKNNRIIETLNEEPVEIIRYDSHLSQIRTVNMIFDKNNLHLKSYI